MRVERILAPNPGPFTGPGTNTYLLVSGSQVLVLDPGPLDRRHEEAILAAVEGLDPGGVLITHTHPDHAPLANPLAGSLEVPALGYGPGPGFKPDRRLADADAIELGKETVHVLHTPGHSDDHLCFRVGDSLFTGDHIMGGSSVVVEDMASYLASLRRLQTLPLTRVYPGHGPEMEDPAGVLAGYLQHRLERERQILSAVEDGAGTVGEIVAAVYIDVDPSLHPLAALSVAAHLRKLRDDRVLHFPDPVDDNPLVDARVAMKRDGP